MDGSGSGSELGGWRREGGGSVGGGGEEGVGGGGEEGVGVHYKTHLLHFVT